MIYVNSVSVYPKSISLKVGTWSYAAYAEVCPSNADCKEVQWHSDNSSVASVNSSSGYIRANGVGTAHIYATATDGSGCSDYLTVTVSSTVPVTSVTLNRSSLSLEEGQTASLYATVCPDNATNKNVNWTSSNNAVATVSGGVVRAVAKGTARITATAADGSGKSDSCSVSVTGDILVTSIELSPSDKTLYVGDSFFPSVNVSPSNATKKSVAWSSANSNIASVNPNSGLVYAKAVGTTTIYATACDGSGVCGSCIVRVAPVFVQDIVVCPETLSLYVGESSCLEATVYPVNATNPNISWISRNNNIASVDSNGCVTAKSAGTTYICAEAMDGSGVYGFCEVTCNTPDTDSIPEHSHIYHATLSEEREEYTFTCAFSQCDDSFTVPKDQVIGSYITSSTNPHLGDSQTPLAYGIDVSYHQGEISQSKWNEIANTQIDGYPITFVILRIGREVSNNADGSINRKIDEQFENNYERAKAAGLHVGCYYYTESLSPQNAIEDAEQVIEWIGNKQLEYPVFFDIESNYILDSNNVPNNTVRTEICTAFMNKMREAGFFAGLYANNNWITNHLNSSTLFPEYDFWYARYYDNTPNDWQSNWAGTGRKFGMWQYTDSKKIAPISGNVDCNVAYKNYPLIIKSLHLNNF